jgi:hypothetical protein
VKPGKGGKAIIGATLLLKGEAQVAWHAPLPDSSEPDAPHSNTVVVNLPETQFGARLSAETAPKVRRNSPSRSLKVASRSVTNWPPPQFATAKPTIERIAPAPDFSSSFETEQRIAPEQSASDPGTQASVPTEETQPAPPPLTRPTEVAVAAVGVPIVKAKQQEPTLDSGKPAKALAQQAVSLSARPVSGEVPASPELAPQQPLEAAPESRAGSDVKPAVGLPVPTFGGAVAPSLGTSMIAQAIAPAKNEAPLAKTARRSIPSNGAKSGEIVSAEQTAPPTDFAPQIADRPKRPAKAQKVAMVAASMPQSDLDSAERKTEAAEQPQQSLMAPPAAKSPLTSPVAIGPLQQVADRAAYSSTSPRFGNASDGGITYDDELILQIQSQRGEIADTISGYGTQAGVYLPFGAIARFLDLAITVSDEGHYASGWFIDEKQTLSINLRQGTLVLNGREIELATSDAEAFDGELFLKAEKFSDLLPLTLVVDLRAQTVIVKTKVQFPFELRIQREQQRERLAGQGSGRQKHRWPRQPSPYQAISFPLADVDLRAVSDTTYGTRAEGDLRLAGDLAFMTARAYVSGTSRDGLTGARIELGRRDPDRKLLGPLAASEYRIGDVSTYAMPIGLRGTSGRGAFITNTPLERTSVFDTVDLRGDLPDGYEVELYRNNILIGSTGDKIDGEYQFLKVAVDYGLNVFRLVFFGPQGQRREEVRQYTVGDGRLGAGEFVYTFGSAQKEVNLFNVRGPNFFPSIDRGVWRSSALLQYGLSRDLTVTLGGAYFGSRFGQQWQVTSGLRTAIGSTAIKLDLGYQGGGGKAAEVGIGGKALGIGYTLTHAEYRGVFTDEVRSFSSDFLRRASEINLNTTINLGSKDNGLPIPLYGQIRRFEFADGRTQTDATLQGSLALKGYIASAALNFASSSNPGFGSNQQMTGSFDLSRMAGSRLRLRGTVDYAILPKLKLTAGQLEADYAVDDRTSVRASVSHIVDDNRTLFGLSAIRRFGKFTLAFDGSYGVPTGEYRAALRLGLSFGRNPLSGGFFFAEPGMASGGAIATRAFRDSNANQLFDPGEEVLPGVDFNTTSRHDTTDKQGVALIGGLGDGNRSSLVIDRSTLPDLSLAPVSDGIEVVARAGRIHASDFALLELSDIEGTAYFSDGGGALGQPVSGLRLVIADSQGKAFARTRTEADGSYFFEQVAPGQYTIQIDKNQAISLKIHLTEEVALKVGPKSGIVKQLIKISGD